MAVLSIDDIEYIRKAVIEAGDSASRIQKGKLKVHRKGDSSIVTEADHMVQEYLIEKIGGRIQNITFIHEEDFDRGTNHVDEKGLNCIIDPIDGTAMFSMYLPIWCVSVGIMQGYRPVYGFVYSPCSSMLFHNDDENSYLNGNIVKVEKDMIIDSETNIFYSTEIYGKFYIDFIGKVRNIGSTALHACLTVDNSRNRVFAFMGKSYLWDWAGAIPIIKKAGGNIKYISGEELDIKEIIENRYKLTDFAVTYNSDNFSQIRKIFKPYNF
jgi:myo-inositol-1(or 4)-monophosphatase